MKQVLLLILGFGCIGVITTCSVYKRTPTLAERDVVTSVEPQFPSLPLPALQTACLDIDLPLPKPELFRTERKPVTTHFTAFETKHVKAKDPLLFASGKTMIIDFKNMNEEAYAFPLPGSMVISPYGGRRRGHSGVDLKTCANDTIVSAFAGIVRMAGPYAAYGQVIVVRHFNGLETVYSHNSRNLVKAGDRIEAGQPIALTGRTGRATTEHLHFEVRINGEHINPAVFFDLDKQTLRKQCYICTMDGKKLSVNPVDPFPYQQQYLSAYF